MPVSSKTESGTEIAMSAVRCLQFYEDLYSLSPGEGEDYDEDDLTTNINPVTVEELEAALKRFKRCRTGADDGLVAEMLKTGHTGLLELLAEYFSDILAGKLDPPDEWKIAGLTVFFKKGDAREPRNYRPISIIPVMAKLFSVVCIVGSEILWKIISLKSNTVSEGVEVAMMLIIS